jgi:hypothetical protein
MYCGESCHCLSDYILEVFLPSMSGDVLCMVDMMQEEFDIVSLSIVFT